MTDQLRNALFNVEHGARKTREAPFRKFLRDRGRSSLAHRIANSKARVDAHVSYPRG